jgi:hypothetical protein
MAVMPVYQMTGIGTVLLRHAEKKLSDLGRVKINLQNPEYESPRPPAMAEKAIFGKCPFSVTV